MSLIFFVLNLFKINIKFLMIMKKKVHLLEII